MRGRLRLYICLYIPLQSRIAHKHLPCIRIEVLLIKIVAIIACEITGSPHRLCHDIERSRKRLANRQPVKRHLILVRIRHTAILLKLYFFNKRAVETVGFACKHLFGLGKSRCV